MDTHERIIRLFEHHRVPLALRHPGAPAVGLEPATTGLPESLDMLDRYAKTTTRGYVGQRIRAHEELMHHRMSGYSFWIGSGTGPECKCGKPHTDDLFVVTDAGMAASELYASQAVNKLTQGGMNGRLDVC